MNRLSERRLAENEVVFRQLNNEIKDFVLVDGKDTVYANRPLNFYCECSNMDCRERIAITAQTYDGLHGGPKEFLVKTGHAMPEIEIVVKQGDGFMLVEKKEVPPAPEDVDPKRFI